MRYNPFKTHKQNGKITTPTIIGNSNSSAVAKYKDTDFYQVKGHGDYIQDNGSK